MSPETFAVCETDDIVALPRGAYEGVFVIKKVPLTGIILVEHYIVPNHTGTTIFLLQNRFDGSRPPGDTYALYPGILEKYRLSWKLGVSKAPKESDILAFRRSCINEQVSSIYVTSPVCPCC